MLPVTLLQKIILDLVVWLAVPTQDLENFTLPLHCLHGILNISNDIDPI